VLVTDALQQCAAGWRILDPASARRLRRADNAFLQLAESDKHMQAPNEVEVQIIQDYIDAMKK